MKKIKTDLRVIKTKKSIKEAFIILINTKGYDRITIQDIAKEAMINRNTFYLHYEDKFALIETLCEESMDRLNICLSDKMTEKMTIDIFTQILTKTFDTIQSDRTFFQAMLSENGYPNFSKYLKKNFKRLIVTGLGEIEVDSNKKITLEYMVSGLVGVICMWIEEPIQSDINIVVEQLSSIHFETLLKLLE